MTKKLEIKQPLILVSVLDRDREFLGRDFSDRVLGRSRVESLGVANPKREAAVVEGKEYAI